LFQPRENLPSMRSFLLLQLKRATAPRSGLASQAAESGLQRYRKHPSEHAGRNGHHEGFIAKRVSHSLRSQTARHVAPNLTIIDQDEVHSDNQKQNFFTCLARISTATNLCS